MDFMKNWLLNFYGEKYILTARPRNFHTNIQITLGHIHRHTHTQARTINTSLEVIKQIQLSTSEKLLIPNQEPQTGIMIARTIADSKKNYHYSHWHHC